MNAVNDTIELIPAIDLIGGRCVRLSQGDYNKQKTYDTNPLDWARQLQDCGIRRLHLVDLDGAKAGAPQNLRVLEQVAGGTSLDIEWGGGIKTAEAMQSVFNAGARRAICGSMAVDHPEQLIDGLERYGARHVILGADVRDGWISTHGWMDTSGVRIEVLIQQFIPHGLTQVICTDISRDGMLEGPNFGLYASLQQQFPQLQLTLSGGVTSMADIQHANDMHLDAVIIGKALYEKKITLENIRQWTQS